MLKPILYKYMDIRNNLLNKSNLDSVILVKHNNRFFRMFKYYARVISTGTGVSLDGQPILTDVRLRFANNYEFRTKAYITNDIIPGCLVATFGIFDYYNGILAYYNKGGMQRIYSPDEFSKLNIPYNSKYLIEVGEISKHQVAKEFSVDNPNNLFLLEESSGLFYYIKEKKGSAKSNI